MKTSLLLLFITALTLRGESSFGQENEMPILDTAVAIDNTLFFESIDGRNVYIPTSFSSQFSCKNYPTQSYCSLLIFNSLTDQTVGLFEKLMARKESVLPLRADLYTSIVSNLKEELEGDISTYHQNPNGTIFLGTLALLGKTPYANSFLKVANNDTDLLTKNYSGTGIGKFVATFNLTGVQTYESLSLRNNDGLKTDLASLQGSTMSYLELKSWVRDRIMKNSKSRNITSDEALTLVTRFLKSKLFIWSSNGNLDLNPDSLNKFLVNPQPLIPVISELSGPSTVKCESVLTLRNQSISKLNCEGIKP